MIAKFAKYTFRRIRGRIIPIKAKMQLTRRQMTGTKDQIKSILNKPDIKSKFMRQRAAKKSFSLPQDERIDRIIGFRKSGRKLKAIMEASKLNQVATRKAKKILNSKNKATLERFIYRNKRRK